MKPYKNDVFVISVFSPLYTLLPCYKALLQNHVLVHPLCTTAIIDDHSMRTFAGNRLRLECDSQGVSVEGSRMRNDFVLGSNGLVHMIDDVLLPNRGLTT
jgi:uncharacterized surface protein with fasciclin (FAS1) repeats